MIEMRVLLKDVSINCQRIFRVPYYEVRCPNGVNTWNSQSYKCFKKWLLHEGGADKSLLLQSVPPCRGSSIIFLLPPLPIPLITPSLTAPSCSISISSQWVSAEQSWSPAAHAESGCRLPSYSPRKMATGTWWLRCVRPAARPGSNLNLFQTLPCCRSTSRAKPLLMRLSRKYQVGLTYWLTTPGMRSWVLLSLRQKIKLRTNSTPTYSGAFGRCKQSSRRWGSGGPELSSKSHLQPAK